MGVPFSALIADGGLKLSTSSLKCSYFMPFVFKEEIALVHKSLSVLSDFSVKFFKSLSILVSPVFSQL